MGYLEKELMIFYKIQSPSVLRRQKKGKKRENKKEKQAPLFYCYIYLKKMIN